MQTLGGILSHGYHACQWWSGDGRAAREGGLPIYWNVSAVECNRGSSPPQRLKKKACQGRGQPLSPAYIAGQGSSPTATLHRYTSVLGWRPWLQLPAIVANTVNRIDSLQCGVTKPFALGGKVTGNVSGFLAFPKTKSVYTRVHWATQVDNGDTVMLKCVVKEDRALTRQKARTLILAQSVREWIRCHEKDCHFMPFPFCLLIYSVVAQWLGRLPPTTAIRARYPAGPLPDPRMWESCWTMPLAGGPSRGTPASPAPAPRRRPIPGPHFMSCPGMKGTYGSWLEIPSLGECCLALGSLPTRGSMAYCYTLSHSIYYCKNSCPQSTLAAAVAERLARSPLTKANRAQSPAG
ncbi:hypothetical protein PR048_029804 [Dryococelus australis]|uniref:Uncharacterized protein n=1 Tax=Dryococelus australis TaxID=614101 RepID=A0ABQ9GA37_9NEOP|nr:hypothetical protein PR048_029804 [Dryococelus australis]